MYQAQTTKNLSPPSEPSRGSEAEALTQVPESDNLTTAD